MTRYLALLRGINVGGKGRLAMTALRAALAELGYANISTYLHSGNAIFTAAEQSAEVLAAEIEGRVAADLGVEVKVLIRTAGQLAGVVAANPLQVEPPNPSRYFVAFLSAAADPAAARDIAARSSADDQVWITGTEAYLWCPGGFSVLGLISLIEQHCNVTATTRNWNTVTRLTRLIGT